MAKSSSLGSRSLTAKSSYQESLIQTLSGLSSVALGVGKVLLPVYLRHQG